MEGVLFWTVYSFNQTREDFELVAVVSCSADAEAVKELTGGVAIAGPSQMKDIIDTEVERRLGGLRKGLLTLPDLGPGELWAGVRLKATGRYHLVVRPNEEVQDIVDIAEAKLVGANQPGVTRGYTVRRVPF